MPTDRVISKWPIALALLVLGVLTGCIADTAEDSDLPWSSNQGWEGMGPFSTIMNQQHD